MVVSDLAPECLRTVLLVDPVELGTVDGDAVLGDGGFPSPFYARAQQASRNAKADVGAGTIKQVARAA